MGNTDKRGIDIIQRGRIDFFFPLKFEKEYDFKELCHKINAYINKEYTRHLKEEQVSFEDFHEERLDREYEERGKKMPFNRRVKKWFRCRRMEKYKVSNRTNDGSAVSLSMDESTFKIGMMLGEVKAYSEKYEDLKSECDEYKNVYGINFTNAHERFVLFPLHVQLNNGEYVWLNVILYIFANQMGILKIELPIVNVSTQPLKDFNDDMYIQSVDDKWGVLSADKDITISGLRNAYLQKIVNKTKIPIIAESGMIRNVILARFNGQPNKINKLTEGVRKDLYKIIAAPVPALDDMMCQKFADEYIERYSWGKYNAKYVLSTTGGCVSIADTALLDWFSKQYSEKTEDLLPDELVSIVDRCVIRSLCTNVEFVFVLQLLKFMNSAYIYNMKLIKPERLHHMQMKYNQNVMFISEIQEHCYGTVSEQVEMFEQMMPYYLKKDVISAKMQAIDRILIDEEAQRYEKLQNFLAIGGLAIALVFGLPAIRETVSIIRMLCSFIKNNIPVLTVNNVSVTIWVFLIAILLWKILKTRRINKRKNKLF